jgi:hypothetical protein
MCSNNISGKQNYEISPKLPIFVSKFRLTLESKYAFSFVMKVTNNCQQDILSTCMILKFVSFFTDVCMTSTGSSLS